MTITDQRMDNPQPGPALERHHDQDTVLIVKRLEGGRFAWPAVKEGVMTLSSAQLAALFEGLDWRRVHARRTPRPKMAG
jgi:transposase